MAAHKTKTDTDHVSQTTELLPSEPMNTPSTRPAATTEQVATSTPPKKEIRIQSLKNMMKLQEQMDLEVSNMKTDLAKSLSDASELYRYLTTSGRQEKDFLLNDPQFSDYVEALGIRPEPTTEEEPTPKRRSSMAPGGSTTGGAKRGRASDTVQRIMDLMKTKEEPVTIKELSDKLGVIKLTVRNNISKLIEEKKVKESGKEGRTILYALVK